MLYLVIAIFVAFITFFIMWIKNGRKVDRDIAITSLLTALDFSATVLLFFVLFLNLSPYNKNFYTEEKVDETYSIKLEGNNAFIQQGNDWKFLRIYFDDYTFKEDPSATVPRIEHSVTHFRQKPGALFWLLVFPHDEDETNVIVVPEGYLDEWLKALH